MSQNHGAHFEADEELTSIATASMPEVLHDGACEVLLGLAINHRQVQQDSTFQKRLIWDVAEALKISRHRVRITSIEPADEHVIVALTMSNGGLGAGPVGRTALELAEELRRQAMTPQSSLKMGGCTSGVTHVVVPNDMLRSPSFNPPLGHFSGNEAGQNGSDHNDEVAMLKAQVARLMAENKQLNQQISGKDATHSSLHSREGVARSDARSQSRSFKESELPDAARTRDGFPHLVVTTPDKKSQDIDFSRRSLTPQSPSSIKNIQVPVPEELIGENDNTLSHKSLMDLVSERQQYVIYMTLTAAASFVLAILPYELWLKGDHENVIVEPCKIAGSAATALLVGLLVKYRTVGVRIMYLQGSRIDVGRMTDCMLLSWWLAECLILCIHPIPFVPTHHTMFEQEGVSYSWETLLCTFVLLRIYMGFRYFKSAMIQRHRVARALSFTRHSIAIESYTFWFKYALEKHSLETVSLFIFFTMFWLAYLVRLAEAGVPSFDDFRDYRNCVWFVIVTMTTTGYGDLTPASGMGRVVAVLAMVFGIASAAIITALLTERTRLQPDESRFVHAVDQGRLDIRKKHLAARALQSFFKYVKKVKQGRRMKRQSRSLLRSASLRRSNSVAGARSKLDAELHLLFKERMEIMREYNQPPTSDAVLIQDMHVALVDDQCVGDKLDNLMQVMNQRFMRIEKHLNISGSGDDVDLLVSRRPLHRDW
eukprot:CAMPEP_0184288584 /NCGR_PEP_ID=MMETSP1049-20130417/1098_1 /TAXON_ID=77928 /ORGANISM="Proteomonas sulcata, Strain CCMP704" /LENGTH=710 /DNA_ID=CAMNT_0026595059 /DNA_START=64 /DNA_END=2193 /DNA_ORIENTATION=-